MNDFIKALKNIPFNTKDDEVIELAKVALKEYTAHPNIGNTELMWRLGTEIQKVGKSDFFVNEILMSTDRRLGKPIDPVITAIAILINTPVSEFKKEAS